MLFDFLIEVLEEEINGESCFIVVAAKHSPRDINAGANERLAQRSKQGKYRPTNAILDQIESDKRNGNTTAALYANKIEVLYFNKKNKNEVFYKALAKGVYWLMGEGVNRGRFAANSKIMEMAEMGKDRPYRGFSSFAATPTNSASHSIIMDNISELVASPSVMLDTVKKIITEAGSENELVKSATSTLESSKETIKDFLCMGLFVIPIKTQDIAQTTDWFNDNYAKEFGVDRLNWVEDYEPLVNNLKSSVVKLLDGHDDKGDIGDLSVAVGDEKYSPIVKKLSELVYICSSSEAIWTQMIVRESKTQNN